MSPLPEQRRIRDLVPRTLPRVPIPEWWDRILVWLEQRDWDETTTLMIFGALVGLVTGFVVIVNVAVVAPAGTVTDAGTVAALMLLLVSVTNAPAGGAAFASVTVPVLSRFEMRTESAVTSATTRRSRCPACGRSCARAASSGWWPRTAVSSFSRT